MHDNERDELSQAEERQIHEQLDRMQAGVERAEQMRVDLARHALWFADDLREVFDASWSPTAQALATADCERPLPLGGGVENVFDVVREETWLLVRSASDHLAALSVLIDVQETALPPITLSRAVYETSLRAESLIDTRDDWQRRTQRALSRRLARLYVDARSDELLGGASPAADDEDDNEVATDEQIRRVKAFAAEESWKVTEPRQGATYVGPRETVWQLAERLFDRSGIGEHLWAATSSVGHGELGTDTVAWLDIIDDYLDGAAPIWWLAQQTLPAVAGPLTLLYSFEDYTGHEIDAYPRALGYFTAWRQAANMRYDENR